MKKPDIIRQLEQQLNIIAKPIDLEKIIEYPIGKDFSFSIDLDNNITGIIINELQLKKIPEKLLQCSHLRSLNLSHNQIQDINPLQKLSKLTWLNLSYNQIQDINPLQKLSKLTWLDLYNNQIQDINPLQQLSNIETLFLSKNQIQNINPLQQLSNIEILDLSKNQIQDINPLRKLTKMWWLNLANNPFTQDDKYKDLKLEGKDGSEQAELLKSWFSAYKEEDETITEHHLPPRLLLLGNSNIGKTCLKYYLTKEEKNPCKDHDSTHIAEVSEWKYKKGHNAYIWDFGGQDYYHSVHHLFFTTSSLYILLYQATDTNIKLNNAGHYDFTPEYWLENINYIAPDIFDKEQPENNKVKTILLAENKIDKLRESNNIHIPPDFNIKEKYRISICPDGNTVKDNTGYKRKLKYFIEEIIEELTILKEKNTIHIAKSFIPTIDKLMHHKSGSGKNNDPKFHYTRQEFIKAFGLKGKEDSLLYLLSNLHDNGLILHYKDMPDDIWLYPGQLIAKIHKQLSKEIIIKEKGRLQKKYIDFLKEHKLLNLLTKQEVIFRDPDTNNYIFPQFLNIDAENSELYSIAVMNLKPVFSLKFDRFLPSAFMTRVLTRFGKKPNKKFYTRYQIIFTEKINDGNELRVWIKTDMEKLQVDVYLSDIKDNSIKSRYISYLFRALMAAYYGYEHLDYKIFKIMEEFIDKYKKENKEDFDYFDIAQNFPKQYLNKNKEEILKEITADELQIIANNINIWNKIPDTIPKDMNIIIDDFEVKYSNLDLNDDNYIFDNKKERKVHKSIFNSFMKKATNTPKKIFISYSHKDYGYMERMEVHLSSLRRQGLITDWNDTKLEVGDRWDQKIMKMIDESDIFILLVSADFINSSYIWEKELKKIKEKVDRKEGIMIPVIVEDCDWTSLSVISDTQAFPYDIKGEKDDSKKFETAIPIQEFEHKSKAYAQVVKKIREYIERS